MSLLGARVGLVLLLPAVQLALGGCVRAGFGVSRASNERGPSTDTASLDRLAVDTPAADKALADKGIADKAGPPGDFTPAADKGIADKGIADKAGPPGDFTPAADKGIADKGIADKGIADKAGPPGDFGMLAGAWVQIPAGSFIMGSPASEPCRSSNETQHQVTLSHT